VPVALVLPADAQVFLGRLTRVDPDAVVRLRPAGSRAKSGAAGLREAGPDRGTLAPGQAPAESGAAGLPEAGRDRAPAPDEADRTALWAHLPWRVLVTREVAAPPPGDITVGAAALLAGFEGAGQHAGDPGPPTGAGAGVDVGGADAPVALADPPRRDHDWRWPLPPSMGTVVEEVPAQDIREVAAAAAGTLREIAQTGLGGRAVGVRVVREALLDHVAIAVETEAGEPVEVSQRLVQAVVRMGFLGPEAGAEDPVRVRLAGRWVGLAARYGTAWLPPRLGPLTVRPAPSPRA
jgi:hypothetical protein